MSAPKTTPAPGGWLAAEPPDSFRGRAAELEALEQCQARGVRLVNVCGPAGIGKTRLLSRWLHPRGPSRPRAVYADLLGCRTAAEACHRLAQILEADLYGDDPVAELGACLAARPEILLVMDHCHSLGPGAGDLAARWLAAAPLVRVVATSWEPLDAAGETRLTLAPLEELDGLELLLDRARAASPLFRPGEEDLACLRRVCARLGGLPLAIELAAAQLSALSPHELETHLEDCLAADSPRRSAHPRHRSLRAALGPSWAALTQPLRATAVEATAFWGGFDLDAAKQVLSAEDALGCIQALVSRGLLAVTRRAEVTRFRLIEPMRAYAASGAGLEAAAARHAAYYLARGESAARELGGPSSGAAFAWLDREQENLRAAAEHLATGDPDAAARTSLVLRQLWMAKGAYAAQRATIEWIQEGRLSAETARRVDVWRCHLAIRTGRAGDAEGRLLFDSRDVESLHVGYELASATGRWRRLRDRCRSVLGALDRRAEPAVLRYLGIAEANLGGTAAGLEHLERAIELCRDRNNEVLSTAVQIDRGVVLRDAGRIDEAISALEHARETANRLGLQRQAARAAISLGSTYALGGRSDDSRRSVAAGLAWARERGDRVGEAHGLLALALAEAADARWPQARGHLAQAACGPFVPPLGRAWRGLLALEAGDVALARGELEVARAADAKPVRRHAIIGLALLEAPPERARTMKVAGTWELPLPLARLCARLGAARATPMLRIFERARVVHFGPRRISLTGREAPWRVLERLVRERRKAPGRPVAAAELFAAGWPGQHIQPRSATQRLQFAVKELRRLGLRAALLTRDGGYLLDPAVEVDHAEDDRVEGHD